MVSLKQFIIGFIVLGVVVSVLALSLRGRIGNPNESMMNSPSYHDDGPIELSPERGRFALTYAIIENGRLQLSLPLARFSTPDVAYENGEYVSLFAPGVPFLIIPGYILGKLFGASQVGSYAVVAIFGLLNGILIYIISRELGASKAASAIGGLVYLFATPSFAYEVSLYQHQFTVFCILLGICVFLRSRSWYATAIVWLLIGCSFVIDSPNIFLLAPLGIFAIIRSVGWSKTLTSYVVHINARQILTIFFALIPLFFLIWYNSTSFGLPFKLAGGLPSVDTINLFGKPVSLLNINGKTINVFNYPRLMDNPPSVGSFFNPRNMLNGFYIEILSDQRGILFFTPVLFLAILGFILLYRRKPVMTSLFIGLIGVDVILYTMWGDPWGGWAFGARYLIPAYSILVIGLAMALTRYKKTYWFIGLFLILVSYSVFVNTLGALTTNKVPPKVQAVQLSKEYHREYKYTYFLNINMLNQGRTLSFMYNQYLSNALSLQSYYLIISLVIIGLISGLTIVNVKEKGNK